METPPTAYLDRPGGRVGYDVAGDGTLLILVPGMGDLRGAYRFMAPALRRAGYRVATTDLRGHGDSDATFAAYGDEPTAGDVIALVEELGGPAVLVGNSMAAGSAVLAAAQRPELVSGIVLLGPFVRNPPEPSTQESADSGQDAPAMSAAGWREYLPQLYAGQRPDDFDEYLDQVAASLRRPGYTQAFSLTTRTDHAPAERRLGDVSAPTLVVMGEKDPDFSDPRAEAEWIALALDGQVVMIPEAGHYPQSQQPELTTHAILQFLQTVAR